ncbi:class I glutamine amidotransferase-like protein [Desarmillaria tabescens]|uniref:Class I glutamine amidotransferase-like protein n=1 Tax=Armillaria tabescens TaxID=1929756 RepID=A0AA39TYB5_ARMTA|nr:class I glutamine amidotransferase-like protein [Desarmillaria tabescens]KAK0469903.1 class I glutamine amidotransferase-like protein [Desarmillaria tabescens]
MIPTTTSGLVSLLLLTLLSTCTIPAFGTTARALVYTATAAFRHDSIPTAVQALQAKGSAANVDFVHTEDKGVFTDQGLEGYDVVIFLSTTGEVLDDTGKTAFQNYLNNGGNFVGIHSASDTLNTTAFYGKELGAYFDYHPELQNATIIVLDASHPSTESLPTDWPVRDEIYNFKSDPRSVGAIVILTVDESSYTDGGTRRFDQGEPHPIAWYQEHGAGVTSGGTAGRSFYTSLGHLNETWEDELFMGHILGGIQWTLQANTTRAFNSSALVGNGGTTSSSSASASASASASSTSSVSETASASSSAAVRFAETSSMTFAVVLGVAIAIAVTCLTTLQL